MQCWRPAMIRVIPFSRRDWCTVALVVLDGRDAGHAGRPRSRAEDPDQRMSATRIASAGACGRASGSHPAYRHVIWIWFENHSYDAVIGSKDAPFTNRLAAACGLATNYHNVTHPSLPNYIAATSGTPRASATTASRASAPRTSRACSGKSGRAADVECLQREHAERMRPRRRLGVEPSRRLCAQAQSGRLLPAAATDLPAARRRVGTPASGAFAHALKSDALATFTFVTPNLCNDTHDCPVSTGDAWLAHWWPSIVSSRAYRAGSRGNLHHLGRGRGRWFR